MLGRPDAVERNQVDKYKARPAAQEAQTLWQFTRKDGKFVPLVSGGQLWTDPDNPHYCLSMFKLHHPWRSDADLPPARFETSDPVEAFMQAPRHRFWQEEGRAEHARPLDGRAEPPAKQDGLLLHDARRSRAAGRVRER